MLISKVSKAYTGFLVGWSLFTEVCMCNIQKGKKKSPHILKLRIIAQLFNDYVSTNIKRYMWSFIWVTSTHFTDRELFCLTLRRMTENKIIDYWKFDIFSSCLKILLTSSMILGVRIVINLRSQLFASGGQSIRASASASVLPMNTQDWSPLGWTGWIPCSPRDSQESSPTPQFKSINSSVLSFLYSPTLTSIHDYWKKPWPWLDGPLLAK